MFIDERATRTKAPQRLVTGSGSEQARQVEIREAARRARIESRRIRRETTAVRDVVLAHRWTRWSAGLLEEPPSFLPESWSRPPDADAALERARRECRSCALSVCDVRQLAAVQALCEVTAARLDEPIPDACAHLSLTARVLENVERTLATGSEAMVSAPSIRLCIAACRTALAALLADEDGGR